jgi:hypothetical protein
MNREAFAIEHLAARVTGFGYYPLRGRLKASRTSIWIIGGGAKSLEERHTRRGLEAMEKKLVKADN